jgi:hypothetical protein
MSCPPWRSKDSNPRDRIDWLEHGVHLVPPCEGPLVVGICRSAPAELRAYWKEASERMRR